MQAGRQAGRYSGEKPRSIASPSNDSDAGYSPVLSGTFFAPVI